MGAERFQAILLPGIVMPAELAYANAIRALGPDVDARAKELELYATDEPPPGSVIDLEVRAISAFADEARFDRFHLVGYSGGGACALAFCAAHPDRVLSLNLNEPAWIGNAEMPPSEKEVWAEFDTLTSSPLEEMMAAFIRLQLAPGVEPPPRPDGPPPPWMAKRPAGIRALGESFKTTDIDYDRLRVLEGPVLYTLGGKSNPAYFASMGERLAEVFSDYTVEVYEERHHFDPPHRAEPDRFARSLRALWSRNPTSARRTT